ncbi:preprotein translocase subunit SecF [Janibacter melonis]|uniref:Protein-export membrane protein SecF n=1 Tax=Janibacter melonis TaxID=262209 RepID=A0A176QB78_9MICO|nr:protein translocase subunit SecF [Janibacter melonis]OAB87001.1 preprotein translocase subunit SecF [Janibacter melonis]
MSRMADFGNDLYTGKRSIDFVGKAKTWYAISAVIMLIALAGFGVRGLNLGLEFEGGSEFRVSTTQTSGDYQQEATDAVREVAGPAASANVTLIGGNQVRVQTEKLPETEMNDVGSQLAQTFGVQASDVTQNTIGASWGASVSKQALRALVVFLVITAALMAVYYRNWKMSLAAMVALAHDMLITVGIYTWSGFEVSPATVIGFLTVLGYSLYDTVVVFDKVRENTSDAFETRRQTFAESANLAVNQTLVRSINTTVIAVLPIIAVLAIGFARVGPGTLLDLSLALFVGMVVGAFSSVYIATPLLVHLRRSDADVVELDKVASRHHERVGDRTPATVGAPAAGASDAPSSPLRSSSGTTPARGDGAEARVTPSPDADAEQTVTGRAVHRYAQSGPRNQPRRTPRSKR